MTDNNFFSIILVLAAPIGFLVVIKLMVLHQKKLAERDLHEAIRSLTNLFEQNWRFVKARFRDEDGGMKVMSIITPSRKDLSSEQNKDAPINAMRLYLEEKHSNEWVLDEILQDIPWFSSCVMWEEGQTIDEMNKEW